MARIVPLSSAAGSRLGGAAGVRPSRRTVLLAATAGLVGAAGLAPANDQASARAQATPRPRREDPAAGPASAISSSAALGIPPAATTVAVAHPPAAPTGHPGLHWREPVTSLSDFGHRVPTARFDRHALMLSLDDGPSPYWTPKFLALLERLGVHATFFLIGRQIPRDAGLVREILARGHVIGNHTWTHDEQLGHRKKHRIDSEIDRTSDAIHKASGAAGYVPYLFRAPGGTWTPRLLTELGERNLVPVGWDVDPTDWARPGTGAIEHSLRRARPRDVVLCHDGGGDRSQTYRALKSVVPAWQQRGYTFATLPRI